MGSQFSRAISGDGAGDRVAPGEGNGLILGGHVIPPELLEVMLSYCDISCFQTIRLVCVEWNLAIQTISFFKAVYDHKGIPWTVIPEHIKYREYAHALLYVMLKKNGFRDNLVVNPCGVDGVDLWIQTDPAGDVGFQEDRRITTESPPVGCDAVPTLPNSCFALSYTFRAMHQVLNLGLSPDIVTQMAPFEVRFSVLVAGRFDCGGVGIFAVDRMGKTGDTAQRVNLINISMNDGETAWTKYSFAAYYPTSQRKYDSPVFVVTFGGQDRKFWAGFYGPKFTCIEARVKLLTQDEVDNPNPEFPRTEMVPDS